MKKTIALILGLFLVTPICFAESGIGLMISLGAAQIESEWRGQLKDAAVETLTNLELDADNVAHRRTQYEGRGRSFEDEGLPTGTLSFVLHNTQLKPKCDFKVVDNSKFKSGLFGIRENFEEPKEITFPSYVMLCYTIEGENKRVNLLKAFHDPKTGITEEVEQIIE